MSVGRNDPCHCGSGEKYKRCHLPKDQAARSEELAAQAAAREAAAAELAAEELAEGAESKAVEAPKAPQLNIKPARGVPPLRPRKRAV